MSKKKAQASRKDDHDDPNTNEPVDIEDFAAEIVVPGSTSTGTDDSASTDDDREPSEDTETDSSVTTFPLTRTFIHCDSTGRELAHVSVTATVTLTRRQGVSLPLSEIERRFRRNFYLSFKGGKASVQPSSSNSRPRRTMSLEHKQKLQEARQRRQEGNETKKDVEPEAVDLAALLLTGFSHDEWRGKTACIFKSWPTNQPAIKPASWTLAIRYLLDTNQIEARGEKRGREYRRVKFVK